MPPSRTACDVRDSLRQAKVWLWPGSWEGTFRPLPLGLAGAKGRQATLPR